MKYGVVSLQRGTTRAPLDLIADYLRGFRGLFIDLKKRPQEVIEACEAILPLMIKWGKIALGKNPQKLPLLFIPLHVPTFLGPQNFEKFYWPTFKEMIKLLTGDGYGCFIFFEGNWDPYLDFLADLPGDKGQIVGLFETADMRRVKQVLGKKMCIAGNFPSELLSIGTAEEIERHAKQLIDDLAPGGGYIFAPDKGMHDAEPDKLHILLDCVQRYGVY